MHYKHISIILVVLPVGVLYVHSMKMKILYNSNPRCVDATVVYMWLVSRTAGEPGKSFSFLKIIVIHSENLLASLLF